MVQLRDYTYLGATQSLCPECLGLVPAKIIERRGRVYFRKRCPTHGVREDFVCSDAAHFDRLQYSVPGRLPLDFGVEPLRGCPFDCGLCTEHEQHTCIGLVEITSSCNLTCPMCYAASAPGGEHLSYADCCRAIDRLVEVEGRPEILQLSGGEPTIHPEFLRIVDYACLQPIDVVMINTNGIRLAHDRELLKRLALYRKPLEVYLQFDGFEDGVSLALRGESLIETKLRAIERLGEAGIRVTLVATLQTDVNEDQIGRIVEFALGQPHITGVSFQPATYCGRSLLPEDLERRITFPDITRAVEEQTAGLFRQADFMPIPCAHPNSHSLVYAYRRNGKVVPLNRFIDFDGNLDLLAGGITFTRPRAREVIEQLLGRLGCCGGGDCCGEGDRESEKEHTVGTTFIARDCEPASGFAIHHSILRNLTADEPLARIAEDFFSRAIAEELSSADVFRITTISFMDAYNFDVRQVMKSCIHHVLPSGHLIPFSAYNVLYRDGHVPLPMLKQQMTSTKSQTNSKPQILNVPAIL